MKTKNDIDYFKKKFHSRSEKTVFSDKILTLPNVLTLSRLIALPFLLLFLYRLEDFGPLSPILVGSWMLLSDVLDGILAKSLKQISLVGAILDPIVDKLSIAAIAIFLVFIEILPFWVILPILLRDFGILLFGLRIFINYGILVTPIGIARVTPFCWGIAFAVSILHIEIAKWVLIPIAMLLTIYSGFLYYRRYKELMKKRPEE